MTIKKKKPKIMAAEPTETNDIAEKYGEMENGLTVEEIPHRFRHHGKHHHPELWRTDMTLTDVMNATSVETVDKAAVCYTTNEVLVIIGLTCVLNLAFIVLIMSCVHFCSNTAASKVSDVPRMESLILVDNGASDSDCDDERKPRANILQMSPGSRRKTIEDYIKSLPIHFHLDESSTRSSSMMSLHSLVPACCSTPPRETFQMQERTFTRHKHSKCTNESLSMENLLFV